MFRVVTRKEAEELSGYLFIEYRRQRFDVGVALVIGNSLWVIRCGHPPALTDDLWPDGARITIKLKVRHSMPPLATHGVPQDLRQGAHNCQNSMSLHSDLRGLRKLPPLSHDPLYVS